MSLHAWRRSVASAELLQTDPQFRTRVQALLMTMDSRETFAFFEEDSIRTSEFDVSYAIIADWRGRRLEEALPFFSKLNLRRTAEELWNRGFDVTCTQVLEVA